MVIIISVGFVQVGGYSIWLNDRAQSQIFHRKVDLTLQLTLAGAANALWQFDEEMASQTFEPALIDADFRAAAVYDNRGNVFYDIGDGNALKRFSHELSEDVDDQLLIKTLDLTRTEEGRTMKIGRLVIVFDTAGLADNRFDSMLAMVAGFLGVTLSALIAVHLLIGRVVQTIVHLANIMGEMAEGRFDQTVPGKARLDELGKIARAIEVLRKNSLDAIEFHDLSFKDSLTGLPNRRALEAELTRVLAQGWPVTVFMVDVDCFKLYNDHMGHKAGDDCLCEVAAAIARVARNHHAYVARYGGEEFTLILPNSDERDAITVAEQIVYEVREREIPHLSRSDDTPFVTVSVGACFALSTSLVGKAYMIERADQELYKSKASGRNRWSLTILNSDLR